MTTKIDKMGGAHTEEEGQDTTVAASSSVLAGSDDMLSLGRVDQALSTKMQLVNEVSCAKRPFRHQAHVDDAGNRHNRVYPLSYEAFFPQRIRVREFELHRRKVYMVLTYIEQLRC